MSANVNRKKINGRKITRRLERKSFRAAEKAAIRGRVRPRTGTLMGYNHAASLRKNKLPLLDE